ncbi:F-box/FBD-like domain protein [Medicago truncatula]|uniref:F-box/FBD-like domain protein n=1 Tax=Medicago truncatula TaxID=3880 RepID=A0A072VN11_MEDTR|nr:F-box/FBD-like domain protein [Medicago truncatula]
MEEANKKPKTRACTNEEHDKLSDLSDELIFRILSFLSTKESHKTCVLSTRWESICTKIPDLNFKLPNISDSMSSKAIQSVYATLLKRIENIRKLSLFSEYGCQSYDVHLWVSKALDLKVQELELECWSFKKPTILPLRLSISKSLVVLKLRGGTQPRLNYSSNFPSLKILHLHYIVWNSILDDRIEFDLSNFLSHCPHLEEFALHDCFKQPINIVSLNSLKRLYLFLEMPLPDFDICPVQINAPSLEDLCVVDISLTPRKYELINLSNLDQASLHIIKYSDFNSLYTQLKGLSNTKSLTIKPETIHFLSMEDNLDALHLLTFHNLLFLSIEISENCSWNMLVSFIQNAPKLEDLAIEVCIKVFNFICTIFLKR